MIYFKFQVEQLLKAKDDQIEFLKGEIVRLNRLSDFERDRANVAVDRLLAGVSGPITPPPPRKNAVTEEMLESVMTKVSQIGGDIGSYHGE